MKTEKNILIAFVLNLSFAVFEFFGGIFTGSVAIISDALHDLGDATSIGIAFYLEKLSKKQPDKNYTYGYLRYSVLGGLITTVILLCGSVVVIANGVNRIFNPVEINYNGMIIFALAGAVINFCAALFTRQGDSLNQKAVNLHMLEDVLGWLVVLVGAIVMRFTDIRIIDPILSILVALFILVNSLKNLKEIFVVFLEKTPANVDIEEIKTHLLSIEGVKDIHHIHLWTMDGTNNYATMHIVCDGDFFEIKKQVRQELEEHNIIHSTLELEAPDEPCLHHFCKTENKENHGHHHHHHHH